MRVLMATDGSSDARQAVDWLMHVPLPADSQVCVVSAMPVPAVYEAFVTTWAELRTQADDVVDDARRRLAERWSNVTARVGARGLGTVKRLLLGSVSESVLRHAACPVLVVRSRGADGG